MKSLTRIVITLPDHIHTVAMRRAAELGISFTEFAQHLFEKELATVMPSSDIDSICGMVEGTPFDMARDGRRIVEEATNRLHEGRG